MRDRLAILGLVLLFAVDVVLVVLAVQHTRTPSPAGGSAAVVTPSVPTAEPTVAGTEATLASRPPTFLSVGEDGSVLAASRGSCSERARPEVTFAGEAGAQSRPREVPGLAEVLGVQATSRSELVVVGLDERCREAGWKSSDEGATWSRSRRARTAWHLDPDASARQVVSPAGVRTTPCRPDAISSADGGSVRVLCQDGRVLATPDDGASWVEVGRARGAVDVRFVDPTNGYLLAPQGDCRAAVLQSTDGGASWRQLVCLPGRRPHALGVQGAVVAAQVGRRLYASTDGGQTWPGA
jgi:hypothetical protein